MRNLSGLIPLFHPISWAILAIVAAVSACAALPSSSGTLVLPEPIGLFKKTPMLPDRVQTNYAVIVAGDAELRHQGNVSVAYQALLELHHKKRNVYILAPGDSDTPWYPWTAYPTREAVTFLFARLAVLVEPHDTLTVYLTGHGSRSFMEGFSETSSVTLGFNTFQLNKNERMTQPEFVDLLKRIKPRMGIIVLDFCYWGVFQELSCTYRQYSATIDGKSTHNTSFGRAFWRAMGKYNSAKRAFEDAAAASPKDHPSVKRCKPKPRGDALPKSTPFPSI